MKPSPITDKLIGIPYRLRHSSYSGADCWGLARIYYRDFCGGIELPDYSLAVQNSISLLRGFVRDRVFEELDRAWTLVTSGPAQTGDLVILTRIVPYDHVSIVADDPRELLHTQFEMASHLSSWEDAGRRVEGVYRYVGQ